MCGRDWALFLRLVLIAFALFTAGPGRARAINQMAGYSAQNSAGLFSRMKVDSKNSSAGIAKTQFGRTTDTQEPVFLYTITNSNSAQVELIDFGATVRSIRIPDKNGRLVDVVLGYEKFDSYIKNWPYLGSTVGRVVNRITAGKFTIDGHTYTLAINSAPNHMHGGFKGFSYRLWKTKEVGSDHVVFEYVSPDGEEGYPSTLRVQATFRFLSDPDRLVIEYTGVNEGKKTTPINLTNHAYFNLCGVDKADLNISGHRLAVYSDKYLSVDYDGLVPDHLLPVNGTPFDLRSSAVLGDRLEQLKPLPGFNNHYYNNVTDKPKPLATLSCPDTGISMAVSSTQPGVQVYTAQYMNETGAKYGNEYGKYSAVALETQHLPDSVNRPEFPSVWLRGGQKYKQVTIYEFSEIIPFV